ncbi:hypothetical protein SLS59_006371 [Nothophoma quercina]|uniref:Aminoglycoside phosphotransferase domain-containing protein n=1 Tax=Nothophoma quercina TaxID=749835 RepID=A0ABR3R5D5_9PLEO
MNDGTKDRQQKIVKVFNKLKAKLWRWKMTKHSGIELDSDGILERCQWGIITKVDRAKIVELVVRQGWRDPVVKIIGIAQVETMNLLHEHTKVPSPEVIGYSATLDNEFGFPYIVMEELPGKSATDLWFEEHGEIPSAETEQKRLTFLRSLARRMTELENFPFQTIGMPTYDNVAGPDFNDIDPERTPVRKYYVWPFCDSYHAVERGPFASTQAYIRHARDEEEQLVPRKNGKFDYNQLQQLGMYKILDMVFAHPVFNSSPEDTFTLRHSDLDTQNILINDEGNITGILDWDGSISMPRCVGHASVPHFMDRDFYPDAAIKSLFLSWRANHYRSIYAAALVEAGNPDTKYTTKSHIYQAAFAALYEGGDKLDSVQRLLREVPGLQMENSHLLALVGKGCKVTEQMLKTEVWKVLEPEMPSDNLLKDLDLKLKDEVLQGCMHEFTALNSIADVA